MVIRQTCPRRLFLRLLPTKAGRLLHAERVSADVRQGGAKLREGLNCQSPSICRRAREPALRFLFLLLRLRIRPAPPPQRECGDAKFGPRLTPAGRGSIKRQTVGIRRPGPCRPFKALAATSSRASAPRAPHLLRDCRSVASSRSRLAIGLEIGFFKQARHQRGCLDCANCAQRFGGAIGIAAAFKSRLRQIVRGQRRQLLPPFGQLCKGRLGRCIQPCEARTGCSSSRRGAHCGLGPGRDHEHRSPQRRL